MAFNTAELRTNPNVQQRWHDFEFYIADSYKVAPRVTADFGVRFSHMQPPYMDDDRMGNFVPATVNPALGNSPCNGMRVPAGNEPLPGPRPRRAAATDRTGRSCPSSSCWFAPRLGVAWDVNGDGKMAVRGGIGRFYQRDRVSPGLGVGHEPALLRNRLRHPDARLRDGRERRPPLPRYGAPRRTRSSRWRPTPTTGSGTSRSSSEIVAQHGRRSGVRRQQGPRPLRPDQPERGGSRRTASPTPAPATPPSGP